MDKEYLKDCIDKNMSMNQIAKENDKAVTTISYWFKKHGLKTNHLSFNDGGSKKEYGDTRCCPSCNEIKPLNEFYSRRGKEGSSVYCKLCTKKQTLDRQRKIKQDAINYKGGVCQECGYHRCNGALEFHHLDPSKKDFSISKLKGYKFNEKIKIELDKCVMLCSNCHREAHAGLIKF